MPIADDYRAIRERMRGGEPAPVVQKSPAPFVASVVYFDPGMLRISPAGHVIVEALAKHLLALGAQRIVCTGHTDTVGTDHENDELSLYRAKSVRAWLVCNGVPTRLITVVGEGARKLAVPTAAGVSEQANRRAEVTWN